MNHPIYNPFPLRLTHFKFQLFFYFMIATISQVHDKKTSVFISPDFPSHFHANLFLCFIFSPNILCWNTNPTFLNKRITITDKMLLIVFNTVGVFPRNIIFNFSVSFSLVNFVVYLYQLNISNQILLNSIKTPINLLSIFSQSLPRQPTRWFILWRWFLPLPPCPQYFNRIWRSLDPVSQHV